jgi:TM2 domain-containing membrane protein YozV
MLYILIVILGGVASYFGPWWVIAPIALALCWWKATSAKQAATIAAAATVSLWVGYSLFLNATAEVNMIDKMADLLTGGTGFLSKIPKLAFVLTIITLISSLIGAVSGSAGVQLREYFK